MLARILGFWLRYQYREREEDTYHHGRATRTRRSAMTDHHEGHESYHQEEKFGG